MSSFESPTSIQDHIISNDITEHKPEPMLIENPNRFVLMPIQHDDIWQMYKKAEASFWTAEEIDVATDRVEWETKLTDNERYFISHIL